MAFRYMPSPADYLRRRWWKKSRAPWAGGLAALSSHASLLGARPLDRKEMSFKRSLGRDQLVTTPADRSVFLLRHVVNLPANDGLVAEFGEIDSDSIGAPQDIAARLLRQRRR